jgi:hypothetical protein
MEFRLVSEKSAYTIPANVAIVNVCADRVYKLFSVCRSYGFVIELSMCSRRTGAKFPNTQEVTVQTSNTGTEHAASRIYTDAKTSVQQRSSPIFKSLG